MDIAVLFIRENLLDTDCRLQLIDDLSSIARREVDLLILNEASPIICMQVLKKGTMILNQDHHAYLDFFAKTVSKYDDLKRVRSVIEKNMVKGRIYG